MASADLLLHPVRLRIVKAFLGDRALTTRQLAAELPDVPAASVYRHVGRLAEAGVLHVVAERRVRGITERTYMLRLFAAQMQPGEVAAMSLEEHGSAFLAYVAGLLGDFDRYLADRAGEPGARRGRLPGRRDVADRRGAGRLPARPRRHHRAPARQRPGRGPTAADAVHRHAPGARGPRPRGRERHHDEESQ